MQNILEYLILKNANNANIKNIIYLINLKKMIIFLT